MLGFLWSFVNPLLLLLTYTLVFTVILPNRQPDIQPFFLFLFCGILPWTWFQASLSESSGILIASSNLIKKVLFPAEVLPTVCVLANLVHFLLGLPILLLFLGVQGQAGLDRRCCCRCRSWCSSCSRSGWRCSSRRSPCTSATSRTSCSTCCTCGSSRRR